MKDVLAKSIEKPVFFVVVDDICWRDDEIHLPYFGGSEALYEAIYKTGLRPCL